VGVLWKVLPAVSLYGQFARGFRAPPYNDVNFGFTNFAGGYTAIPNAGLKSERSRGFEYGVRFGTDAAQLSITGFSNRYTDFISSLSQLNCPGNPACSPVVPLTFQSVNIGRVKIAGWEIRGRMQLDSLVKGLSANLSMGETKGDNLVANAPLDSVDPRKTVVGARYDAPSRAFGMELIAINVAAKTRTATATQFRPAGYTLLDANLYWTPVRHVELVLGVNNLTDKKVWQWSDVRGLAATSTILDRFTQPGRNVAASVKLVF
jgi:hemoglobin/transferrin/lactoferrin receptor protein